MRQEELYPWTAPMKQVFWELGVRPAIGLALYSDGVGNREVDQFPAFLT